MKILLPVAYDDGQLRDYGLLTPLNVAMTLVVANSRVRLTDVSGVALNPQGIAFQVTPPPPPATDPIQVTLARKFPPPDATFVHAYTVSAPLH
ncbi:MAG TPA: hypothetical protein VN841_18190 [Bryobacteraceae bacterium]|nr:hypothetical protein [Bryobacteraceae bacterium]